MSRSEAYEWLASKMGIPQQECHFGWFTAEQCNLAMAHCNNLFKR